MVSYLYFLEQAKKEGREIYILISSQSFSFLSGDSRKKCVSGEKKGKNEKKALFTY